jgi:hypothetical protein
MHPCSVRVAIPRPVIALALALLTGALLPAARGQIPFEEPYVFAGVNLNGVALGDADGDGNSDLFASASFGSVRVLLGSGDGHFETSFHVVNGFSTAFDVADLDGDGRDDVVTVGNLNGLQVWLAVGGGDYVGPTDVPVSGVPHSVEAADLDADGDLDLVVGLANGQIASIALGDGDGGFTAAPDVLVPDGHDRIRTGDVNGDGLVDLVSWKLTQAAVELGLDSARVAAPIVVYTPPLGHGVDDLDVGDINRDGADDLAILESGADLVYGQVGGLPLPPVHQNLWPGAGPIRIVDADGDAHPDLAIGADRFVSVNLQSAGGSFGPSSAAALAGTDTNLAGFDFGDIDHDGTLDMASASLSADLLMVHSGQGDGGFRPAYGESQNIGMSTVVAADLDLDGRLDLLLNSYNVVQSLRQGGFDASFGPRIPFSVGLDGPVDYDVSDANGDGLPDLLSYASGVFTSPAKVTITPGDGDLTFGTPVETIVHSSGTNGDFVDFNGDGRTDLVMVGQTGGNQARLSMMANEGVAFALDSTLVFPSLGPVYTVEVVDLDEDGILDVVVSFGPGGLAWLEGFPGGGFAALASVPGFAGTYGFTLVDMTEDGHLDVVALTSDPDTLVVAPGHGDGTFGAPLVTPTANDPEQLLVDDLDGDGRLDVAFATSVPPAPGPNGTIWFYLGQGGGALSPAGGLTSADAVRDLRFVDTNLDGATDLIVLSDSQVMVLLNGDGPWEKLDHPLPGAAGYSGLVGEGTLQPSTPLTIAIHDGPPLAPIVFVVGTSAAMVPFKGGTLVPQPLLVIPAGTTNGLGALKLGGSWPASVPSGASLFLQAWLVDAGGPAGFSATNALSGTTA